MEDFKKKIAFVCNVDWFFLSHRLPLALHAIANDYSVYLLTRDTGKKEELVGLGIHFIDIPFERSGKNVFHEMKCIRLLCQNYKKYDFDIIHHITLKASLLGSISAKLSGQKNVVNAISGFGYNFTNGRNGILQKVIKQVIKIAFKSNSFSFILQNQDDFNQINQLNLVPTNSIYLIEGSGIDLNEFSYMSPKLKDKLIFLFPARLLYDKGIQELLDAAQQLDKGYRSKIKFILAGDLDYNNLASISEKTLRSFLIEDYIEWIGYQKNMYDVYVQSDIVILPSYREGLPKSLIEACAVGRPIITTNVPGCKSCIIDGENGYRIEAKDVKGLKKSIETMCNASFEKRLQMGRASRKIAVEKFSIDLVISKTFSIYDRIFNRK